jgi:hypothetical protein
MVPFKVDEMRQSRNRQVAMGFGFDPEEFTKRSFIGTFPNCFPRMRSSGQ